MTPIYTPRKTGNRILVALFPSRAKVKADSTTLHLIDVGNELAARGNYVYFFVAASVMKSPVELPPLHKNTHVVYGRGFEALEHMAARVAVDTHELVRNFQQLSGIYQIDAVLMPNWIPQENFTYALTSDASLAGPALITVEPGRPIYFEPERRLSLEVKTQAALRGRCCVLSDHQKRIVLACAATVGYSPSQIERAEQNIEVTPLKLPESSFSAFNTDKPADRSVLLYAGRANYIKNFDKILKAYDDLYRQGEPVEVVAMTQDAGWGNLYDFTEATHIKQLVKQDRDAFYTQAGRSHVFMCWSDNESFNATFREAALLGNVCLCVDSPDMRMLFGDTVPDQLFFKPTHQAAVEKVRWAIHNRPAALEFMRVFVEHLKKDQTRKSVSDVVLEHIERHARARIEAEGSGSMYGFPPKGTMYLQQTDAIRALGNAKAIRERGWFSLHEFLSLVNIDSGVARTNLSPWQARNVLTNFYGLTDLADHRFPHITLPA